MKSAPWCNAGNQGQNFNKAKKRSIQKFQKKTTFWGTVWDETLATLIPRLLFEGLQRLTLYSIIPPCATKYNKPLGLRGGEQHFSGCLPKHNPWGLSFCTLPSAPKPSHKSTPSPPPRVVILAILAKRVPGQPSMGRISFEKIFVPKYHGGSMQRGF